MKLAKQIDMNTETGVLTIDGEPLGYFISDDPITITAGTDQVRRINLTLLAEHASVTGPNAELQVSWKPRPDSNGPGTKLSIVARGDQP